MPLAVTSSASPAALWVGGTILGLFVIFTLVYDRCISARASWQLLLQTLHGLDDFAAELPAQQKALVKRGIARAIEDLPPNRRISLHRPWLIDTSTVLSGWRRAHQLDIDCWTFAANEERARERLFGVRGSLSLYSDSEARQVMTRIDTYRLHQTIDPRPLLADALRVDHDHRDTFYESLANRQTTGAWFTMIGAAIILIAALIYHREPLLLFGALGGFLSRAARLLRRRPSAMDYGVSAVVFLLAPIVGAMSGWAGVAITQGLVNLKVLDADTFGTVWDQPRQTTALAVAFAFGFVERLIDRATGAAASTLTNAPPASDPLPDTANGDSAK